MLAGAQQRGRGRACPPVCKVPSRNGVHADGHRPAVGAVRGVKLRATQRGQQAEGVVGVTTAGCAAVGVEESSRGIKQSGYAWPFCGRALGMAAAGSNTNVCTRRCSCPKPQQRAQLLPQPGRPT